MNKLTQHQKILIRMSRLKDEQEWFFPYDFMPPKLPLTHDLCVGYEASARLTELATDYPDMIESQPDGKYKKRRVRWETMAQWFPNLPKDLRYAMHRTGVTRGIQARPVEDTPKPPPPSHMRLKAVYLGFDTEDAKGEILHRGQTYDLALERLVIGKPVVLIEPVARRYADIKAFRRDWKAV